MISINSAVVSLIALAASAVAQSSSNTVTSAASTASAAAGSAVTVTFPGGYDNATFVASLVGTSNSLTTLLVGCSPDTPVESCDFYPPIFITANPSTIIAQYTYGSEYSYTYSCTMSAGGATCVDHETGIAADFATQTTNTRTLTSILTYTTTDVFNATDISSAAITLVTGNPSGQILGINALTTNAQGNTIIAPANNNSTASASSSSRNSTASSSSSSMSVSATTYHPASTTTTSTSASAASASSTSSNDVAALAPGFFGAALLGLAAVLL